MSTSIVSSPEDFFGFKLGSDKKLARWDKIVEYFWHLNKLPTVKVQELGKSTEGNPFILAIISSPINIQNLDRIREISLKLSHPQNLTISEVNDLVNDGKTIVSITCSIHASEVGGTQMSSELAYELATNEDPIFKKIRENTVLLLVPSSNPDGNIMVVDWYNKNLGTEYEDSPLPYLYHKYVGHDNNRDAFNITQIESKHLTKLLYKDWYPQAQIDHHHMGSYGARFSIPPNSDPIYPYLEPLVLAEQQLYGGMMLVELEATKMTGVETQCTYSLEGGPFWNHAPLMHGICGMLTESASAKLATPIYVHKDQLRPSQLGRPENKPQMNFPHPWEGGWWHLLDVVKQIKIASIAALKVASNHKEQILKNMYLKAKHQIELGLTEPPYAYVFTPNQRDRLTTYKLLKNLQTADVKVHQAEGDFEAEGICYPKGTYVIFTSQTCRPYILRLLKSEFYPESAWTKNKDGSIMAPFDYSTFTQQEFMGVNVVEVTHPLKGNFKECINISPPIETPQRSDVGYILDCIENLNFKAVNKLLKQNIIVYRVEEELEFSNRVFPVGSFYIANTPELYNILEYLSKELSITFHALPNKVDFIFKEIKHKRIGLYKRYYGGNMDEGWTRWLFEQYEYDFKNITDADIKDGLGEYDVLILPSDSTAMITGEKLEEYYQRRGGGIVPKYPEEYRSGIGKEGISKIKEFIENGGTVITLNRASDFAIEELKVPITNVLKDLKLNDFLCPGSTLKTKFDNNHPIAYGMPENGLIVFSNGSAFSINPNPKAENIKTVATFPEQQILISGWLVGEKHIREKSPLVEVKIGQGKIVLFGFSPQNRAQTDATFKLLFNSITS
ncbi:peptidase M14 family protein [Candidatus Bathyarchaeota archaeon]|nr:peptidase M14 family protein [Candidatus Bathyarchaeota archaeon]